MTEPAADERFDDPDLRLVHPETTREREMHVIRHLRHRVQREPSAFGIVLGKRGVGLHHRLVDLGVVITRLAHEVGASKPAVHVAEHVIDLALDIAGLVEVQWHGVERARRRSIKVGRPRLEVDFDGVQGGARHHRVDGGDRGDRFAPITDTPARQRKLVLGDGNHPVGHVAVIARDHCTHPGQRTSAGSVDAPNLAMGNGAAQDHGDERAGRGQVGGVARAAGDLLDAVDQRLAYADRGFRPTDDSGFRLHRTPPHAHSFP